MRYLPLMLFCLACVACDTDLNTAYDDYRAQAPAVCKDYCEERVACERATATGVYDDDAFTTQVHQCTVDCTSYASEGSYVWQAYTGIDYDYERSYNAAISADDLMDSFQCLYDIGAYRCVEITLDSGDYEHRLNPPVPSVCSTAYECIRPLGTDFTLYWQESPTGIGGTCEKSGSDFIDAVFFDM